MSTPPYPQGPPPPGRGPIPPGQGPQQWVAYPSGPPVGPPPRRKTGWVWAVLGVVLVLVAGGVTYLLVAESDDEPVGGRGGGAGCSGEYCVGGYPYVNACQVLDPLGAPTRLGSIGTGKLFVQEIYADPLPRIESGSRPSWAYRVDSRCSVSPEDREGAAYRTVTLQLDQSTAEATRPAAAGRPLPGAEGALVEDSDGRAEVSFARGNTAARLDVSWGNDKTAIADTALAEVVNAISAGLATAAGEPRALGDLSEGDKPIVLDACAVYTGADFQAAARYVVDPTTVTRSYSTSLSAAQPSRCRRTTAPKNAGFPVPDGTTFLDGAMAPTVTVAKLRDAAAARAELAEGRERTAEVVDIPGIGDGAVYGIDRGGSDLTLRFTKGFHLVTVSCGLSNGNADWTAEDMRVRLQPLAEAIAARMP